MYNDWYIFANGKVEGPLPADQVLAQRFARPNPDKCLVSRNGFSRWYPLDQLSQLLHATEQQDAVTRQEIRQLEELVSNKMEKLSAQAPTGSSVAAELSAKLQKKRVETTLTQMTLQSVADRTTATLAKTPMAQPLAAPKPAPQATSIYPQAVPSIGSDPKYDYYILRGRLRLGQNRNPFVHGILLMVLTAGLYFPFWLMRSVRELSWHADNTFRPSGRLAMLLSFIPVLHLVAVVHCANVLRRAEEQNRYRATNAWLALFLGIFPPFAMMYLQSKINHHWRLHVKHAS